MEGGSERVCVCEREREGGGGGKGDTDCIVKLMDGVKKRGKEKGIVHC